MQTSILPVVMSFANQKHYKTSLLNVSHRNLYQTHSEASQPSIENSSLRQVKMFPLDQWLSF